MALEWLMGLMVEVGVLVLLGGAAAWWLLRRLRRIEAQELSDAPQKEPDPPTHH